MPRQEEGVIQDGLTEVTASQHTLALSQRPLTCLTSVKGQARHQWPAQDYLITACLLRLKCMPEAPSQNFLVKTVLDMSAGPRGDLAITSILTVF